jgi:hypothetical protein
MIGGTATLVTAPSTGAISAAGACGDLQDGRVVRDRAEITDEAREDLRNCKALLKKL